MKKFEDAINKAYETAIREWEQKAPYARVWLCYLPNKLRLTVMSETEMDKVRSENWELVTGQAMPGNVDRAGLIKWMVPLVRRVPFLPVHDEVDPQEQEGVEKELADDLHDADMMEGDE